MAEIVDGNRKSYALGHLYRIMIERSLGYGDNTISDPAVFISAILLIGLNKCNGRLGSSKSNGNPRSTFY
jgi:hypothetical protein